MLFNDKIILRKAKIKRNKAGCAETTGYEDVEIWAGKKSVTRAEFYAASAAGTEATAVFEINADEYGGQKILLHGGKEYEIIRTYQKDEFVLELTCKAVDNG